MTQRNKVKSYVSSIFISFVEWFEFLIFVYIFLQIFNNDVLSIFQKIGIILSFIARPFGALLFGKLSVNVGRISSLLSTVNLMIISSLLIIAATYFMNNLIICITLAITARILQGAAIGGEVTTSLLYIYEISKNKATAIAFAGLGSALGMALASYAPSILNSMSSIQNKIYLSYGFSIIVSLLALCIRRSLIETKKEKNGIKLSFNKEYFKLGFNIFKYSFPFVFIVYYVFLVLPDYFKLKYNISSELSEQYIAYFSIFTGVAPIIFGVIADKIGLDKVLKFTVITTILYIPLFIIVKNPLFHLNALSIIMSLYFCLGFTKLFETTDIDKLYLSFPFLYNLIVAIISSQIVVLFNINIDHDYIFIFSFILIISLYIKEIIVSNKIQKGKRIYEY